MPYEPPPELASLSLAEVGELAAARKLPPVDEWRPERIGDSRMRIAADGRWFHDGGLIARPAMVRAFASLLMRDDRGRHWLMTPHERLSIEVDDAAFIAVDVKQEGPKEDRALAFLLNTDEFVVAGPEHKIVARGQAETPAIYLQVRHGTEARLNRSTWAQLAEIALEGDGIAVSSLGMTFLLVPA